MHPLTRSWRPRLGSTGGRILKSSCESPAHCHLEPTRVLATARVRRRAVVRRRSTPPTGTCSKRAREGAPEGVGRGRRRADRGPRPARPHVDRAAGRVAPRVGAASAPRSRPRRCHLVTMAAGLACIAAVRELGGIDAGLKWPNDVVVDDRKLAGILAEKDARRRRGRHGLQRALGHVPRRARGDRDRVQSLHRPCDRPRGAARRVARGVRRATRRAATA